MTDPHVPLGADGWLVWRDALVRSAGFPADGLAALAAPACAAAADALLDAPDDPLAGKAFETALDEAADAGSAVLVAVAADPRFREAVTWQNPNVLSTLDVLVRDGPHARRGKRRRAKEDVVLRYWQRYCLKNDTVGFFGPAAWATVDPGSPAAVTVRPGPDLVTDRRVALEAWAAWAYADRMAADPEVRRWLPPALAPQLTLDGRRVLRPARQPVAVSPPEAAALFLADGSRSAVEVVSALVANPALGLRREADGYLLLDRLAGRGLLRWDADVPLTPAAADVLVARVAAIGDEAVRRRVAVDVRRLIAGPATLAAAAGDPDALRAATAGAEAEFTALTGREPARRAGETYAGRRPWVEDCTRDVEVVLGGPLLAALAEPLALLLRAARWYAGALAEAYASALREVWAELGGGTRPVRLDALWFLAQGPLFGSGDRPVDAVARDFAERWQHALWLPELAAESTVELTAAALRPRIEAAFPVLPPRWSAAALHSPDLQLCAESADALARGEFLAVLGELHAAWPTFDSAVFTGRHPDPERLRDRLAADLGPGRVRLLYPADFPRYTSRLAPTLDGPTDRQLAFASAPGADRARLLPVTAALVEESGGELVARTPDGWSAPLLEVFSALVAMHAVDGFKLAAPLPHTPRVTVDRLVLARETWRSTVDGCGLAAATGERGRYLAVRRWRRELGLPERVFVKLGSETKPSYADLSAPRSASSLCSMVRAAAMAGHGAAPVTVTEMLPAAEQSWLPDVAGRRYSCELRLQVVDPLRAEAGR
ncbi:MAG TPA: lantibiotic dehydratase [Mycobacteriales bacterium]